mgnify:CR=1 FL=1
MIDLDKQFAELADTSAEDSTCDFVIDEDLRIIAIPERGVVLGVEGDKDANRIRFRMNKTWRGYDMSKFDLRINYQNANGDKNYYTVTSKHTEGNAVVFDWIVAADAVAYQGDVFFIVVGLITTGGMVNCAFHTTLGKAKCLEGLVVDTKTDISEIRDFMATLKAEVEAYGQTFVNAAAASAKAAKASETTAVSSASAAKTSETNSVASAKVAKTSETNASTSASAAKTSETNAGTSAASAQANAKKAEAARDDANTSKTAAAASAAAAKKDAQTASSAASTATGAASAAKTSETNAGTSASNAKGSETKSGEYLQAIKEYFEQVRTITLGAQGWYETSDALTAAVPVGENGWWAVVGTTDSIWVWDRDTNAWRDSMVTVNMSDYYTRTQVDEKLTDKANKTADDLNTMINTLSTGSATPQDADYYVSQYAGGGSTTTTYHRRPMSALWTYIKSKAGSVFAAKSHTHNYAGSGSAGGSANSAVKLDTATAGSATKPVYISGGKPVACTHSLGKDVPANAVFTDHTYTKMTAATASAAGKEGLVPAPAAGAQGKFLRGDGTWQAVAAKEAVDAMLAEIQAQVAKAGAPTERLAFVTQISANKWGWNQTMSCEATIPKGVDFIRITPNNFDSPYVFQFSANKDLSLTGGNSKAVSAICASNADFKYTASNRKIKITAYDTSIGRTCIQGYKYGTAATPCIVWTEGDGTSAKDHDIDYIEIKERWNSGDSSNTNTKEAVARVVKGSTYATAGGATVTFASDGTVTASEYSGTLVGYRYMTLTEVSEQLASTQSALADADALNLDQDYRLTLLELGVTDDETTA